MNQFVLVISGMRLMFFYKTLFEKIKLKFPFSFEKQVLSMLNVSLTQLHLNGLAFVRCFELLCHNFNINLTLEKSFYFFESRVNKKSGGGP